jgi:hypothetical protein
MVSTKKAIAMALTPQLPQSAAGLTDSKNREKAMSATNSVVAVYDSHDEAERAIWPA